MNDQPIEHSSNAVVRRETALAIRNTLKLSAAFLASFGVAIAVRFWLPRFVGVRAFGQLHFAESFATACFIFTQLGVHSYINREVAKRPDHASEFFGGILVARLAVSLLAGGIMVWVLQAMGKDSLVWQLTALFAIGQVLMITNRTLNAFLHATGNVSELSWARVGGKLLWGGGIVIGLLLGGDLTIVAVFFIISEIVKMPVLLWAARKYVRLTVRFDFRKTRLVLIASLPFFINGLAHTIYSKIDVTMLSWITNDLEVGWYGAAMNMSGIILMFLPVVTAVVLPMGSRVVEESKEALAHVMNSAGQIVLVVSVFISMVLGLNAQWIVTTVFGDDYLPGARAVMIAAATLPLAYQCVLCSIHLFDLHKVWQVIRVSLVGLVVNPLLNVFWIPAGLELLGPGGAASAAAAASLTTELIVFTLLVYGLGRDGAPAQKFKHLFKIVLSVALIVAAQPWLQGFGAAKIPMEMTMYALLGWVTGTIPYRELTHHVGAYWRKRRGQAPTVSEPE